MYLTEKVALGMHRWNIGRCWRGDAGRVVPGDLLVELRKRKMMEREGLGLMLRVTVLDRGRLLTDDQKDGLGDISGQR